MLTRGLTIAIAALLLAASAAHAQGTYTTTAYGEGVTTCAITVIKNNPPLAKWDKYSSTTRCTAPIEQSAQVCVDSRTGGSCATCQVVSDVCQALGYMDTDGAGLLAEASITLRAPRGQGWATPAGLDCWGMGTDLLHCDGLSSLGFIPLG